MSTTTSQYQTPKPQSSLDFLAALRQEYRAQQQQALGTLRFSRLPEPAEADHPRED